MGGGMFICLPALVKSSHTLCFSYSPCQRVPYHFRWQWKTGMTKHHRCWHFSFSLRAQTQRVRHRQTKKKNIPPHISAFSSHLTANALWVMLEPEHSTENLWMSLYTYMDDEDAFWVPLAWQATWVRKGRSDVRRIQNKWSNLNYLEVQTENSTCF